MRAVELGLLAVDQQDETEILRVFNSLRELGIRLIREEKAGSRRQELESGSEAQKIIAEIGEIGAAASKAKIPLGVFAGAVSLGGLGQEAAKAGNSELLLRAAQALGELGKTAARAKLELPFRVTASALREIGKEAAGQKMEEACIASQLLLKELGELAVQEKECFGFGELSNCILGSLREIGKEAAGEGLETAAASVGVLLEAAQLRLNSEFSKLGMRNFGERRYYEESCNAPQCLGELGIISAQQQLKNVAAQAYLSLGLIRKDAAARYLGNTALNAEAQLASFEGVIFLSESAKENRKDVEKLQAEISGRLGQVF
ncbi:MAG: hypothetical protein PHU28_00165 [Methanosarcinaceae archaeon]|nr:hypothetical protein [Methanosarcinaceae archaeon]